MDIYRFIQSEAMREHLKRIDYTFSGPEMAYIIWQCPDATLEERIEAWQEITDTLPDCLLPECVRSEKLSGFHDFLKKYIELQQEFLNEFYKENGVYFYRYVFRERPVEDEPWDYYIESDFEYAFSDLKKCEKAILDDLHYQSSPLPLSGNADRQVGRWEEEVAELVIKKQTLSAFCEVRAFLNENMEILDVRVPDRYLTEEGREIFSVFSSMNFYIPTPFQRGDILYRERYYPDLMFWGDEEPFVFDSVSSDKDEAGMGYYIFLVDDDCPTGNFLRAERENYLALEYYRGELNGLSRFLKAVSSFLKGKLPFETLIQTWIVVSAENMRRKEAAVPDDIRIHQIYSGDDLAELTGLKTMNTKKHRININVRL